MLAEIPFSNLMSRKGITKNNILIIIGSINIICYIILLRFSYNQFSIPAVFVTFILFALVFFARQSRLKSHLAKQTK